MSPNISFFHSGLNVNSNLFQFSLHTDKSFSAVKDFSNWSYLRSVIELQKNVSPGSITSTNTLFCCHNCKFFTAYVFVLPNTKKKKLQKEKHVPCSDTLSHVSPSFVIFLQLRSHFRKIDGEWIPQSSNYYKYFTYVYRKKTKLPMHTDTSEASWRHSVRQ